MSVMGYISFPRQLTKHQISYVKSWDENEFKINLDAKEDWEKNLPVIKGRIDGRISIWDMIVNATFNNCFKNPFIYEYCNEVPDYYYEQTMAIISNHHDNADIKTRDQELIKYWSKEWSLKNQVLHKYLHDNLNVGEFVEIYESVIEEEDASGMIFGPPTIETIICINELLCMPYTAGPKQVGERIKLTIHKTD